MTLLAFGIVVWLAVGAWIDARWPHVLQALANWVFGEDVAEDYTP